MSIGHLVLFLAYFVRYCILRVHSILATGKSLVETTQKDILLLAAGAFIAVIINYFTNFTSPAIGRRLQQWREAREQTKALRSADRAKRRIEYLKNDLEIVSECVSSSH